jgi:hypothetical protein
MDLAPVIFSGMARHMIEKVFLPQLLRGFTNRIFFKKLTPGFAESSVLDLLKKEGWDKLNLFDLIRAEKLDNALTMEILNSLKIGFVTLVDVLSKIDKVLDKTYLDLLEYLGMYNELERVRKAIEIEKTLAAARVAGKTLEKGLFKYLHVMVSLIRRHFLLIIMFLLSISVATGIIIKMKRKKKVGSKEQG